MDKETAHKIRPLVEDKKSMDAFLVVLEEYINQYRIFNDNAAHDEVLRNQGAIGVLGKLKHLRQEVLVHTK